MSLLLHVVGLGFEHLTCDEEYDLKCAIEMDLSGFRHLTFVLLVVLV